MQSRLHQPAEHIVAAYTQEVSTDEPFTADPRDKHEELAVAIERVYTITSRAESLLNRINGTETGADKKFVPLPCSTLSELLANGHKNLHSDIEQVHKVLEEIEQELF